MARTAALAIHAALGAVVAVLTVRCCGPDIAGSDLGVELLGLPTWLLAAALIVRRSTDVRLRLLIPLAWFALMFVVQAMGVYVVAY